MMRTLPALLLSSLLVQVAHAQTGGADVREIVRGAIARRAGARAATGSLAARIHTVSVIDVRNDSSMVALLPSGTVLHESVGSLYHEGGAGTRIRIYAQRGSRGAEGIAGSLVENFRALGDYISFDGDRIVLLNTSIVSPLASDALDYYDYRLVEPSGRGEALYRIDVSPSTRLRPAFQGSIWVTRDGYDLVETDLMPSERTAVPFVNELRLRQHFSRVDAGPYQLDSITVTGRGLVRAVAFGVVEPRFDFTIASHLADRRVNVTLPDSVRLQPEGISITGDADSVPAGYWAGRGLLSASQVAAIEESHARHAPKGVTFGGVPYIDYNRAGSLSAGLSASMTAGPATVGGMGGYSFGLKRPLGEGTVALTGWPDGPFQATVRGSAFSQIATTTTGDKSYPRIMNTLVAASLHQDYYDFYRKDGWSVGADLQYEPLRLTATFERSRQFSIGNNASWSLLTWTSKEFQPNPPIEDGSYGIFQAELAWGRVSPFLKITPVGGIDLRWSLAGMTGRNIATDSRFGLGELLVSLSIPVAQTGYTPITLVLLGAGGTGTASLPPQYQFRLRTSAATFGKPGGLVSPPKGLYGGTEYLALGGELNLTDLLWRAAGLPVHNGRGVELLVAGAGARYRQRHATGYRGTGDDWYTEAGIGLSRIPLFLTDIVAGRVDLRWGLGPLGQFGGNFTFVVPI